MRLASSGLDGVNRRPDLDSQQRWNRVAIDDTAVGTVYGGASMRFDEGRKPMRTINLAVAATIMTALAGPAQARSMHCAPVNDAQVKQQFDRFNAAWATKNPDIVTALFAPDAVLLPTLSDEERTTPAGIHKYFVYFLKNSPVGRIDSSSIRLGCNMAARMGNWSVDLTDSKTGKKSTARARYTFVYTFAGGKWRIEHLHSSLLPDMP